MALLFAFTLNQGFVSKKEATKTELTKKHAAHFEGGQNFPHNTGMCECGYWATCHPTMYFDMAGNGHISFPGQNSFPPNSTFVGNKGYPSWYAG